VKYINIQKCRICYNKKFISLLNLGKLVSCGLFSKIKNKKLTTAPLEIVQCLKCRFVQTKHNYELKKLFTNNYGFRSGLNTSMKFHLKSIVKKLEKKIPLLDNDIVLDIGSNDGTTLGFYKNKKLLRIGIDPTISKFKKYYNKDIVKISDFFSAKKLKKLKLKNKIKIITSIAMFYDLQDPNIFLNDIKELLHRDGIWFLELSYLPSMIEANSFDTICHEHLGYYTLGQMVYLSTKNNMKIIDVSLNDTNGGSFQILLSHKESSFIPNSKKISKMLKKEKIDGYNVGGGGCRPIKKLAKKIEIIKKQTVNFLKKIKKEGKVVHGYGASTKGNTLLQYFNIKSNLIEAIAECNKTKFGCYTPGTWIPIISEKKSRSLNPDYYFVLPWHFKKDFLRKENNFLKKGGKFVFPLPNFEIVSK
jgi:hypothetical protein